MHHRTINRLGDAVEHARDVAEGQPFAAPDAGLDVPKDEIHHVVTEPQRGLAGREAQQLRVGHVGQID